MFIQPEIIVAFVMGNLRDMLTIRITYQAHL